MLPLIQTVWGVRLPAVVVVGENPKETPMNTLPARSNIIIISGCENHELMVLTATKPPSACMPSLVKSIPHHSMRSDSMACFLLSLDESRMGLRAAVRFAGIRALFSLILLQQSDFPFSFFFTVEGCPWILLLFKYMSGKN